MKKYLLIGLVIILLLAVAAGWLLNFLGVISFQEWGEQFADYMIAAPLVGERAAPAEELEQLQQENERLQEENRQLEDENYLLLQDLEEAEEIILGLEEEMGELQARLDETADEELAREERIRRLINVYSAIDPYDAAPIISAMERELALLILSNINPEKTAIILTRIQPSLAAELSLRLQQMGEEMYREIIDEYDDQLQEHLENIEEDEGFEAEEEVDEFEDETELEGDFEEFESIEGFD